MQIEISEGMLLIGRTVGSEIISVIENATKSIRVISQQVSPRYVQLLRAKNEQGINVQLITTENNDSRCYSHLITRNEHADEKGIAAKSRDIKIAIVCLVVGILMLLTNFIHFSYSFLLGLTALVVSVVFFKRRKKHRLRYYSFSPNFEFKVFRISFRDGYPTNTSKFFVNGKLYIIDDSVAYLGSGNLTESGMNSNYETFVKITSPIEINKLIKEYNVLFNHEELQCFNTNELGAIVYGFRCS